MKTWCAFYIAHIRLAFQLPTLSQQIAWLSDASTQFVLWLIEVRHTVMRFANSSKPDEARLNVLTTLDCAPARHLLQKQEGKKLLDQSRQAFDWIGGGASGGGQPAISALRSPLR